MTNKMGRLLTGNIQSAINVAHLLTEDGGSWWWNKFLYRTPFVILVKLILRCTFAWITPLNVNFLFNLPTKKIYYIKNYFLSFFLSFFLFLFISFTSLYFVIVFFLSFSLCLIKEWQFGLDKKQWVFIFVLQVI